MDNEGSWIRRLVLRFFGDSLLGLQFIGNRLWGHISLIDPTVLVSNTENLLVKWGVGVTIDWPENFLQSFPTPWPAWLCGPF